MICLQGGAEFGPGCREMDAALLDGLEGPVVVTALAGTVGADEARATANGVRHFAGLGAVQVLAAPDARTDRDAALGVIASAGLVVLPGGSPRRLLEALTGTGLDQVLADVLARGGRLMGASAGAMVLGPWTVLPEGGRPVVARGLGLSPFAVVPHWNRGSLPAWERPLREAGGEGLAVLGLPEQSGVVLRDGSFTAVGQSATRLITLGADLEVGESRSLP